MLHGFEYRPFLTGDDLAKAKAITGGSGKRLALPEVNDKINELLRHSIKSEGVIPLFSDMGTALSLFDLKFLEEVASMKEKNLAVELLKRLIAEQVAVYRRTNVVKSEVFSQIIQSAMNRYLNGMLTNEEVIAQMLKLAKEMARANAEGEKPGRWVWFSHGKYDIIEWNERVLRGGGKGA